MTTSTRSNNDKREKAPVNRIDDEEEAELDQTKHEGLDSMEVDGCQQLKSVRVGSSPAEEVVPAEGPVRGRRRHDDEEEMPKHPGDPRIGSRDVGDCGGDCYYSTEEDHDNKTRDHDDVEEDEDDLMDETASYSGSGFPTSRFITGGDDAIVLVRSRKTKKQLESSVSDADDDGEDEELDHGKRRRTAATKMSGGNNNDNAAAPAPSSKRKQVRNKHIMCELWMFS